ncbi:SusC/RagA family TonB-linked outer membrane protein [Flavivirga jejuensis]|uniref:TonB-dependent receptor n=1 Tax=Flavivirga jejuensis TaxID=870487 RepID=A0ABT8WLN0_9FLAO|nr:TonB-dependent receptor [Flavivirga jejuensis]MDO5974043.1 TonB-dependent receptor [Flavivirga jejuensis]
MKNLRPSDSAKWKDNLIILKMKLTFLFSFMMTCGIWANSLSQSTKISLNLENASVSEFVKNVEDKTDFYFIYQDDIFKEGENVSINVDKMPLDTILAEFEKQTSVVIKVFDNQIVISKNKRGIKKIVESVNSTVEPLRQVIVTGTLLDINGNPLPGANIIEKGTTNGTLVNFDGHFSLSVTDKNAILVASYIGFATKEVQVNGQTNLNIVLEEDTAALDEIIVVGYGTQKKETLTGSVVHVKGNEIVSSPAANVSNSLAGRLPGLIVNQTSGQPGADDPRILVRGNGTTGDNDPLIIIDGVERSGIGRLNPNDIESISVLKDATAAIYGARAANGVVIVTTKSGKIGKPTLSVNFNQSYNAPTRILDVLDGPTYARTINEGTFYRAGRPDNFVYPYSEDFIQQTANGSDPILFPNTDWVDAVLKDTSNQKRLDLTVQGGTETIRYLTSFGYTDQNTFFENDPTKYEQYNFRLKLDVDVTQNFNLGLNISGNINNTTAPSNGFLFHNILLSNPLLIDRYPNGLIAAGRLGENPLLLNQRGSAQTQDIPVRTSFTGVYNVPFLEGLKISGSYNYDFSSIFKKTFITPYFYHEYDVNTGEYIQVKYDREFAELRDRSERHFTSLYNFKINYDNYFEKHYLGVMLGSERQKNTNNFVEAYRTNYLSAAIDEINVGSNAPEDKENSGSSSFSGYNNYFGRLNYDFDKKYLLEFVFRYDGSQIFPESDRYGFFPAVSAAWRIDKEHFIKSEALDLLKIRVSYGEVGNDAVGQYQYLQTFSFADNYVFGSQDVPGIRANTIPNPNITWEVSQKTDIGLEANFWNNLLGLDLTFFKERRKNILTSRNLSIPDIYGFSGLPDENIGEVENQGFEMVINHRNTIGDFSYSVNANLNYAASEVIFLDETPPSEAYQAISGSAIDTDLVYVADGIFNTQEELDAYPHFANAQVGDIKLLDLNNDGELNSSDQKRSEYSSVPEYVFGLYVSAEYKGFDLNMLWQGQANAYNIDAAFRGLGGADGSNGAVARANDRWTIDNINGTMPRADDSAPVNNTFWQYNQKFVRLKQLEIGYSFSDKITKAAGLSTLRFYLSGFNLLTFAANDYIDPEAQGNHYYYPQIKTFNVGFNLKF